MKLSFLIAWLLAPLIAQDAPDKAPVRFPSVGVTLIQPAGFSKSDSFDGFGQPETKSSVVATKIPGPFAKVTGGFAQAPMKARGWTLLSREEMKIDGLPAVLVHFEQPAAGTVFSKWVVAFGDESKTMLVTATLPKNDERELSERMKATVLSVKLDKGPAAEPGADLPFTLEASGDLKVAPGISRTLTFTRDGVIPAKSPRDPLFIASAALNQVQVRDHKTFADKHLRQTAQTKGLKVKSVKPITIDGLEGFESQAEAQDLRSGTPLSVYHVILFPENSYIVMVGLVGREDQAKSLPAFKAMARSLTKKSP